ncbi:NADPH oxidase 3 [Coemansia spiralis]|nr:NADPH oxidase 3 [Coemansia spiralis]
MFIPFVVALFLHNRNRTAYKYLTGPLAIYIADRGYRIIRGVLARSPLRAVIQHPSGVVELQLDKRIVGHRVGQYVKICCPSVSLLQWHPLTISSAPEEEHLVVHFRPRGGWTHSLARHLGCSASPGAAAHPLQHEAEAAATGSGTSICKYANPVAQIESFNATATGGPAMPMVLVDGPYATPSEHFFDYSVCVLIAAGIGITPAAAVLRSLYFRRLQQHSGLRTEKVYLFWVYRDIGSLEWFNGLLAMLRGEDMGAVVETRTYFTGTIHEAHRQQPAASKDPFGDNIISAASGTSSYTGRPDFDRIFGAVGARHPGCRIGTFLCGPKQMVRSVRRLAHRWDRHLQRQAGTRLDFYSETF